jgi:hypothetical protein
MLWAKLMKIVVFMLGAGCISIMLNKYDWTAVLIMAAYGFLEAVWFGLDYWINEKES